MLACRRALSLGNVRGSVGQPIPGTQLRIVDPERLFDVADGEQGLILARGPGVMKVASPACGLLWKLSAVSRFAGQKTMSLFSQGYFQNDGATAKAFRAGDGWFDTGDLGWRAPQVRNHFSALAACSSWILC